MLPPPVLWFTSLCISHSLDWQKEEVDGRTGEEWQAKFSTLVNGRNSNSGEKRMDGDGHTMCCLRQPLELASWMGWLCKSRDSMGIVHLTLHWPSSNFSWLFLFLLSMPPNCRRREEWDCLFIGKPLDWTKRQAHAGSLLKVINGKTKGPEPAKTQHMLVLLFSREGSSACAHVQERVPHFEWTVYDLESMQCRI